MRNSGKPYVSRSRAKKEFPARKMRPPCGGNANAKLPNDAKRIYC